MRAIGRHGPAMPGGTLRELPARGLLGADPTHHQLDAVAMALRDGKRRGRGRERLMCVHNARAQSIASARIDCAGPYARSNATGTWPGRAIRLVATTLAGVPSCDTSSSQTSTIADGDNAMRARYVTVPVT